MHRNISKLMSLPKYGQTIIQKHLLYNMEQFRFTLLSIFDNIIQITLNPAPKIEYKDWNYLSANKFGSQ